MDPSEAIRFVVAQLAHNGQNNPLSVVSTYVSNNSYKVVYDARTLLIKCNHYSQTLGRLDRPTYISTMGTY